MNLLKTTTMLLFVLITLGSTVFAQTATGEVNGTVIDPTSAVIPGFKKRTSMPDVKTYGLKLLFGLLCFLFAGVQGMPQTVTGTISGTVVDSSGAVIAGATIVLINERTADSRTLLTNDEGDFSFAVV